MFVLMSKKAAQPAPPPSATAANKPANVRTQNACDACRISKSKAHRFPIQCDGTVPCARCQNKWLACTTSRLHAKAVGPISAEHVATLQAQQRRLALAVSAMAHVIKQAESRGFVEDDSRASATVAPLSPVEMAHTLQRFAPDDPTAATVQVDSTPEYLESQSKKRRLIPNSDVPMADSPQLGGPAEDLHPFEKFFAMVKRQNIGNPIPVEPVPTASTQPVTAANEGLEIMDPSAPTFEFHPQLAPFVDLIDWEASLEHFVDSQYDGENFNWADLDTFNVPDTMS